MTFLIGKNRVLVWYITLLSLWCVSIACIIRIGLELRRQWQKHWLLCTLCQEWLDINVNFFYIIKFTDFVMLALFSVLSFGKEQNQWWFIIRLRLEIVFEKCICLPVVRFVCTACSFLIRLYLLNLIYIDMLYILTLFCVTHVLNLTSLVY
jgi:hypothetical protein